MRKYFLFVFITLLACLPALPAMAEGMEPSGDYYGWTILEAMTAECEARGLSITDEELKILESQAEEGRRQYAALGENVDAGELLEEIKFDFLFERLRQALPLKDNITQTQVREWYEIRLNALENAFRDEPGIFKSQQDLFDKHGGVEPLTVPEGYVYVRHILTEDIETAELVLEKLESGEDFVTLMRQYGTDDGMNVEPYAGIGYLVGPYESKVDYLPEFKRAALALENIGDYSGIVKTQSGYEIIQLISRLEAGVKPLEAVYDQIHELLLKNDQSQQLIALLKDWVS